MDAQTMTTLRCTACGALAQASCSCGVAYTYMTAGEVAAKAVKDSPDKSDRVIAAETGVGAETVRRARKAGAPNEAPDKRTGRDGKKYPTKRRWKNTPKQEADAAKAYLDNEARTLNEAAAVAGLGSVQGVKTGVAYEQGRRDAFAEIGADADFSKITVQQKRDAALRVYKKELDRGFEQRVRAEYTARVKKQFPNLDKMQREAAEEKRTYERLSRERKHIMTVAEFNLVCSCLHPDSRESASAERLLRTFQIFNSKMFVLTGVEKGKK